MGLPVKIVLLNSNIPVDKCLLRCNIEPKILTISTKCLFIITIKGGNVKTNLKRNKKGFTIIEVMIVLAIAALILVIVLIAAPALQRNSRNTQIRNDANVVLGYVNEWAANNNGALPGYACATTNGDIIFGTGTAPATCTGTTVGRIRNGVNFAASTAVTTPAATEPNFIRLNLGRGCALTESGADNAAANDRVSATANTRAAAISFLTEGNNAVTYQCVGG